MRSRVVDRAARRTGDDGFSLIEQIIAMTIIVGALLGLLTTLGAAADGVSVGRQRTIAVSLAKQVIENLEGAAYASVSMSTTGLSADPLIRGASPNLTFEGESIVPGGTAPYRTTLTAVGTTFATRTYVTAVPAGGSGYRRVTVIVEWPATAPAHTMRFASLVYPLDYASFPAASGSAEATGGLFSVSGKLGDETFDDVHVVLPAARADTDASTLRTAIAAGSSAESFVDVQTGVVQSASCTAMGIDVGECARQTDESIADNDSASLADDWVAGVGPFLAGTLTTPGGSTMVTPSGTMSSRASTDDCAGCGFGDFDGLPWAEAAVSTTTATFTRFDRVAGAVNGNLWTIGAHWDAIASVDHDANGNGTATASARLSAPAVQILQIDGGPQGFDGAVRIGSFAAKASAVSGYTLVAPDVTTGTTAIHIDLWDGAAYRAVDVPAGSSLDTTATGTFPIGDRVVTFTAHVQAQRSTFSSVGSTPRSDAVAQHPSILVITVDVTVTAGADVVDAFTVVADYGRVSAHAGWLAGVA